MYPRFPVYDIPESAPLKNVPAAEMNKLTTEVANNIIDNFDTLTRHVVKLETILEEYNKYAEEMNRKSAVYKREEETQ